MRASANVLVCTIRAGTRAVCRMSSSPSSLASLDWTMYRDSSPGIGCTLITTKGPPGEPKGMGSALPVGSMCTTTFIWVA